MHKEDSAMQMELPNWITLFLRLEEARKREAQKKRLDEALNSVEDTSEDLCQTIRNYHNGNGKAIKNT